LFGTKFEFMMGGEIAAYAAKAAGAKIMFGYPITPTTEILETWAKFAGEKSQLKFVQTEDETSAGFGVIGAILAGVKAFTTSAGPGHVLLQDPISMAEAMRLPFVVIIGQRGGPSTGQVIYSQQEVNLACFGGNGEGLRLVYAPSNLQELYDLTILAFQNAWRYRFPTIVLADGYLLKAKGKVNLKKSRVNYPTISVLGDEKKIVNLANTFNMEEDLNAVLEKNIHEYKEKSKEIVSFETHNLRNAKELIIAFGSVASACQQALEMLKKAGKNYALFRPITLRPLASKTLNNLLPRFKKIIFIESSAGQLEKLVKGAIDVKIETENIRKPAMAIMAQEIYERLK